MIHSLHVREYLIPQWSNDGHIYSSCRKQGSENQSIFFCHLLPWTWANFLIVSWINTIFLMFCCKDWVINCPGGSRIEGFPRAWDFPCQNQNSSRQSKTCCSFDGWVDFKILRHSAWQIVKLSYDNCWSSMCISFFICTWKILGLNIVEFCGD